MIDNKIKKGLGRGLSSLLGDSSQKVQTNKIPIQDILSSVVYYLTDPLNPIKVHEYQFDWVHDIHARHDTVYFNVPSMGLEVYDYTNSASPIFLGSTATQFLLMASLEARSE